MKEKSTKAVKASKVDSNYRMFLNCTAALVINPL